MATASSTNLTKGNAASPDYQNEAYRRMQACWTITQVIKDGTPAVRNNKVMFLPKFENEDVKDYDVRVLMTFVNDHYAQTISDHVGLVFATQPELSKDVDQKIKDLLENIDGEGTHWQVFMQTVLEKALDYGHAVIFTDFPQVQGRPTKRQAADRKLRPYCSVYAADQIVSWRVSTVGGVRVVTQIVFKEDFEAEDLNFGIACREQYRVLKQEVVVDEFDTPVGLGKITWELFREKKDVKKRDGINLISVGTGEIKGPQQIPVRIVYGGPKIATLESRPHLLQLAYSVWQETQIESDYANIMHKCNVPTPVFIGRNEAGNGNKKGQPIKMGSGIDIPVGGSAMILEPSGNALAATRTRLEDLRAQMRRQGAFVHENNANMTATEAAIYARQRNARLVRAARSLKDAGEGMLSDLAAYATPNKKGGSMSVATDFASFYDTKFTEIALKAYQAGVLPLDAMLNVLMTGKLPEEFDVEAVALRMMAENPPPALILGNGTKTDKLNPLAGGKKPADPTGNVNETETAPNGGSQAAQ